MNFISLTLLIISGITDLRSDQYSVVGPADPVFAVAGEDVILPCSVKPIMSVVDMRVEWFRSDLSDSQLVHLYEDHEDRNTEQIQSYRERTQLTHQQLQTGNASLRLSTVKVSDEGRYNCLIQSKFWFDDATVVVNVEAAGSPPVISVDGFDHSGGLRLQCESEGWSPEPDLQWLDSKGVRLSSETTETHRNTDGFRVKHTIIVHHRDDKIHCRVKLKHHMLETVIITTGNVFDFWRTAVIVIVVLSVTTAVLISMTVHKYREHHQLENAKRRTEQAITRLKKLIAVNVVLDADSAHPRLIVSDDGKQVRDGKTRPKRVDWKKFKFNKFLGVLGKEGFSSGCFYFEVKVKGQTEWDLGVARESVDRKGRITLSPDNGYWTLGLRYGLYFAYDSKYVSLSLSVEPQRVGVFVDHEEGFVSFYDVESMSHMYSYTRQSFNDKLCPFLCLGYDYNTNSTPLIICDDF